MTDQNPNDVKKAIAELTATNDALEAATDALVKERETAVQDMETEFAEAEKAMAGVTDWLEENTGNKTNA